MHLGPSNLMRAALTATVKAATMPLGRRGLRIRARVARDLETTVTVDGLTFVCENDITFYRADHILDKEPETIAWIDAMKPGETLWDIGANIGAFTLYALKRGVRVVSFEPFHGNYATLTRNIRLNGFDGLAFQVALSDRTGLETLLLSDLDPGSSRHNVGAPAHDRYAFTARGTQGIATTTMDAAMASLGQPDHIKIDVDGLEQRIVAGGAETLRRVRSVLIEVDQQDPTEKDVIGRAMAEAGLTCADGAHPSHYRAANMIFTRT